MGVARGSRRRIALRVECDGHPMGSSFTTRVPPELVVEVVGTAPLESVEVFRGLEPIASSPRTRGRGDVVSPRHARLVSADGQSPLIRPDGGRLIDPPSLLSGMFVKVRIPIESRQELLRIPTEALRPHGEVWAVVDQKLQKVTVDVARELDDFVLLRATGSPIAAGALVKVGASVSGSTAKDCVTSLVLPQPSVAVQRYVTV